MSKRKQIALDPTVAETLAAPPGGKRKAPAANQRSKATYDLDPATIQEIREIADHLDVPVYAVAQRLLDHALEEYRAGRLELRRKAVVTTWGLE